MSHFFKSLIHTPLRVYLILGTLACTGLWAGTRLPVSLFPNTSKPMVGVNVSYPSINAEEFANTYGKYLEYLLASISTEALKVERSEVRYDRNSASYKIEFEWGNSTTEAAKEVANTVHAYSARFPAEIRDSVYTWSWNRSTGYFATSFYSEKRSLEELFQIIDPLLTPEIAKIPDANEKELFNPLAKEVRVTLKPYAMAQFQIWPRDIDTAIRAGLAGYGAGSVKLPQSTLPAESERQIQKIDDFRNVVVTNAQGKSVYLSELASIDYSKRSDFVHVFKTGGNPSLILWVTPKADGNVKKMSEDIIALLKKTSSAWPDDVKYDILVDPSQFIGSAIHNTLREILLGAALAVVVLFFFIGSFRNTITTAIEIPLSMCLAFILMRWTGMNLNLISLGGLALASGMNVDASVVVLENILRHLEQDREAPRSEVVFRAVREVWFPVVASTLASVVVFLPLAFTSALANAVLGDLARAVIFSHAFSAIVALILVPTVRLHLMRGGKAKVEFHSPIERGLVKLERGYQVALRGFLGSARARWSVFLGCAAALAALGIWALPTLHREMIGEPDTDWVVLNVRPQGAVRVQQIEDEIAEAEVKIQAALGPRLLATFTRIHGLGAGYLNIRLKNKADMREIRKKVEDMFPNSPRVQYEVSTWNPSELPIPNPPQLKVGVRGGTLEERLRVARLARDKLDEAQIFPRVWDSPDLVRSDRVDLRYSKEQWAVLQKSRSPVQLSDLFDLARVATEGKRVGWFPLEGKNPDIMLRFPDKYVQREEDLESLPFGVDSRIFPLRSLLKVHRVSSDPFPLRENQQDVYYIYGSGLSGEERMAGKRRAQVTQLLKSVERPPSIKLEVEDSEKDLNDALSQLRVAIGVSIFLIFLTMVLQFGSVVSSLLVLAAIPLGWIGVMGSLVLFKSTLSLNSALGVILLNGIAVANSIILVDFIHRKLKLGLSPVEAAVEASRVRLRPILITSLTTILAMLPIALGFGEGGRILQPLGIAVAGGLWVSTLLTLFVVPALQVMVLEFRARRSARRPSHQGSLASVGKLSTGALGVVLLFLGTNGFSEEIPLEFLSAVETAIDRDPNVLSKKESLQKVEWASRVKRAVFLPSVSFFGSRSWAQTPGFGSTSSIAYGLTSELNLFRFGADLSQWHQAGEEFSAEEAALEATILDQEQIAVGLLVEWIHKSKEAEISQTILDLQKKSLGISRERFRRGMIPIQEVEKIEVDVSLSENSLNDLTTALMRARSDVEHSLGHVRVSKEWQLEKILKSADRLKAEVFDKELVPKWKTSEFSRKASEQQLSRSKRLLLPSLGLSAGLTQTQYFPASSLDGLGWSVGLAVSWPVFDQLSNYSTYRMQAHSVAQAEYSLESATRAAHATWEKSRERFQVSLTSVATREKNLKLSRKLFEDGLRRFQAGRANANELFVDHRRWLDSELYYLQALSELHLSTGEYCHSLGKRLKNCLG